MKSCFEPPRHRRVRSWGCVYFLPLFLVMAALAGAAPAVAGFPPVSDAEKALTEVPGAPGAQAVILASKGEVWMVEPQSAGWGSALELWQRIKILTPEGARKYGEVVLPYGSFAEVGNLRGRTLLPDGRELRIGKEAVFHRRSSKTEKALVTAAAFPAVEVGAILDLEYTLLFDAPTFWMPWYFQSEIPTLSAEIVYHIPEYLQVGAQTVELPGRPFQQETEPERNGYRLRVWAENLPALRHEPFAWPREDLSARFLLYAKGYYDPRRPAPIPWYSTWEDICERFDRLVYSGVGVKSGAVRQASREITAGSEGPRAAAKALYRFVRDRVQTDGIEGISIDPDLRLGQVLERGRGTPAEKALLLHGLLQAAKIESVLVWVTDRREGRINLEVSSPGWFHLLIVRATLPGRTGTGREEVYLDPSDPSLGFGFLRPQHEGMPALIHERDEPRVITIPMTSAAVSRRHAQVDLTVDEEGRLSGHGELELSGHHAWAELLAQPGAEATREAWSQWLEKCWQGFGVSGVEVEESVAERRVRITWDVRQNDEEVLGDEVSLQLCRPLGPAVQLFQLAPERRKTPVLLPFPFTDELRVRLTWPEGWEVEALPEAVEQRLALGEASARLEVDEDDRNLVYERRFEIHRRQLTSSDEYGALRSLFEDMEKHDAQSLVLVAL